MIPKILHYVWVGGPLPEKLQKYIASWSETNPSFTIMKWDESNIEMTSPLIRAAYRNRKFATVADIARLQAVAQLGGIYMDTDFIVLKPLDVLLEHSCFCGFQEVEPSDDWVSNGVFGAEPNHWFISKALQGLHEMRPPRFLPDRPTRYGPKHLTKLLRQEGLDHYSPEGVQVNDIFVTSVPVFFPFHYTEAYSPECVTERTLAVHFWEGSWETSVPLPMRLLRGINNNLRGRRRVRPA